MKILSHKTTLFLFLLLMFFSNLALLYPSIMEARNFVSAREMLQNNDFLLPTLNGMPRYEKPPFPTWITAFFGSIFGTHNTWALRIPNAIVCILGILYLKRIVFYLFNNKAFAYNTSFVAGSVFLILYVGKSNVWDVYSNCFILIAMYYFLKIVETDRNKYWLAFSICTAVSMLSKGPMGFIILFLPFFTAYVIWINKKLFKEINYKKAILFGILTIFLGTSWYIYVYLNDHDNFMKIFEKETAAVVNRNVKPWYRYLSFPVQSGIWAIPAIIALFMFFFNKTWRSNKKYITIIFWTLGSVFLLSLLPEKKERYLFPVMFPLSIIIALGLHHFNNFSSGSKEKIGAKLYYILIASIGLALTIIVMFQFEEVAFFPKFIFSLAMLITIVLLVGTIICGWLNSSLRNTLVMLLIINILGFPIIITKFFDNPNYTNLSAQTEKYPNLNLYSYEYYSPEVWYNYQKVIPNYNDKQLLSGIIKNKVFMLLVEDSVIFKKAHLSQYKVKNTLPFDENKEKPGSKNYKLRKKGIVYVLELENKEQP